MLTTARGNGISYEEVLSAIKNDPDNTEHVPFYEEAWQHLTNTFPQKGEDDAKS